MRNLPRGAGSPISRMPPKTKGGLQPTRQPLAKPAYLRFLKIFALHLITENHLRQTNSIHFQFPLLGFLLCIVKEKTIALYRHCYFQFPLLGFLLCIFKSPRRQPGLFTLAFNSLYWDFCFASSEETYGVRKG